MRILRRLSTPAKIQDYLDALPLNWEKNGETYFSPRRVLREQKAHCFEGALLAALALWLAGREPLLLDLKTQGDDDHVVALFRQGGYWGAISKTNHAVLRWRDPVYRTVRELALSYFNEYYNYRGRKTLRSYSKPFKLKSWGEAWVTAEDHLDDLAAAIDHSPHYSLIPATNLKFIRRVGSLERRAGELTDWSRRDPRT
ncbi:MAG: hypothetical protein COV08_01890 [Candidatus Vogelbacteria bacterium CG10_big_fil_rev_8_21_14_0_10_49_38]|uniref:Transglutaminase-like domain-containing protein n=1 Tax=Candidatus Vogelbacteria bacterium CG10_big_fil_rev_8_21_14_0_10_49_38 TaxID=1975043 RepID=A0A2H0RHK5_9BACT|nr:MAG: hypothetical protein BK006_01910 [bacterium CG10_49_38]PIR46041.1 MAG: hypothetical protein COV08_01890 [Candidatus Vogelbacteria bacterium CG10_big_fil_rev_8_21_14_0_10_49_38]